MVAEEALEIIVDLLHKAGPIKTPQIAKVLFEDIETLAISYEDMDYQTERDLVRDDGWYQGDRWDMAKAGIEIAPPKFPAIGRKLLFLLDLRLTSIETST